MSISSPGAPCKVGVSLHSESNQFTCSLFELSLQARAGVADGFEQSVIYTQFVLICLI